MAFFRALQWCAGTEGRTERTQLTKESCHPEMPIMMCIAPSVWKTRETAVADWGSPTSDTNEVFPKVTNAKRC